MCEGSQVALATAGYLPLLPPNGPPCLSSLPGVDGTEVGILEQTDQVGLARLLRIARPIVCQPPFAQRRRGIYSLSRGVGWGGAIMPTHSVVVADLEQVVGCLADGPYL